MAPFGSTDTSQAAAAQRAREQLSGETAKMVSAPRENVNMPPISWCPFFPPRTVLTLHYLHLISCCAPLQVAVKAAAASAAAVSAAPLASLSLSLDGPSGSAEVITF